MQPATTTIRLELQNDICHLTFNRPEQRNAMNGAMLNELLQTFDWLANTPELRAVVLRGAGGMFCAGADLKDLESQELEGIDRSENQTPTTRMTAHNRRFGLICRAAANLDVPVVAVIEGAALGGGFGLTCVADISLALTSTTFGLPETQLGLVPAQIAPFAVERIGAPATRRLALTGARFKGQEAAALGLVDHIYETSSELDNALAHVLKQILRCAPSANRATKRLLRRLGPTVSDNLLDHAAHVFASHALSPEGREGIGAFVQKHTPGWVTQPTPKG